MNRLALFTSAIFALVACDGAPAKASDPSTAPPVAADQNYTTRIVPGEAKAGAAATSVIEILPAVGYKMNVDFPSRLVVSPLKGAKAAKSELTKGDAEVSEKVLRFNVKFTADAVGMLALEGAADFSVCNESTCKLIRDEKLTWEVAVK